MSMYLSYASPLAEITTRADLVSPEERMEALNHRRPSTNDSHTIYHFGADGVVDYCYVFHQSFRQHGFILEYFLRPDTSLDCRMTNPDGSSRLIQGLDAGTWMRTQRADLLMT